MGMGALRAELPLVHRAPVPWGRVHDAAVPDNEVQAAAGGAVRAGGGDIVEHAVILRRMKKVGAGRI